MTYQYGMFENNSDNIKKIELLEKENQLILPVDALQQKYDITCPMLTEREFQIMQMVLTGLSIQEIALSIFLSVAGVKWRLSNIYLKFVVKNRLELIKKSAKEGLHFISENLIKHTFHNRVNLRDHDQLDNKNKKDNP